jgi:hypothetical protein
MARSSDSTAAIAWLHVGTGVGATRLSVSYTSGRGVTTVLGAGVIEPFLGRARTDGGGP